MNLCTNWAMHGDSLFPLFRSAEDVFGKRWLEQFARSAVETQRAIVRAKKRICRASFIDLNKCVGLCRTSAMFIGSASSHVARRLKTRPKHAGLRKSQTWSMESGSFFLDPRVLSPSNLSYTDRSKQQLCPVTFPTSWSRQHV